MLDSSHLFFDLDRTLWDFDTNSQLALQEIFQSEELEARLNTKFNKFYSQYVKENELCWDDYRLGVMSKEDLRFERFLRTLKQFNSSDKDLAIKMGDLYVAKSPMKTALIDGTKEVLDVLSQQGYRMHIITNGFEEIQHIKLSNSGIDKYFEEIITSERAGVKKPHEQIFLHSLKLANAHPHDSVMIGDDLPVDILGAKSVGMKQVYFNPEGIPHQEEITKEIKSLKEMLAWIEGH